MADFGGSADYSAALALADFTISPATPTVNVVDAGGTYDGLFYDGSASVAGLAGVSGLTLEGASLTLSYYAGSSTGGMPLGAAPLAAGTYTVLATFPGSADYGFATASVSFNIAPAVPTVDVSDPSGSFDGSAFVGSATVAGVSGPSRSTLESISPTLSYYSGSYSSVSQLSGLSELSGAPVWAGTYTVLAAFPGSTDYTAAAGLATLPDWPGNADRECQRSGRGIQRRGHRRFGHRHRRGRSGWHEPGGRGPIADLLPGYVR